MTAACGIDVGSLRTPADVAWLDGGRFVLGRYVPSAERPLPDRPPGVAEPACFALDAPQGLPARGATSRVADREARTPTSVLPERRAEVAALRAYGPLVEAGLTIFWACRGHVPPVVETYPRFVVRTLWPELAIPSKRKEPRRYVAELWPRIRALGYGSRPPGTPDEVDAMLCALAAEAYASQTHVQVGVPAVADEEEGVLREGVIVAPTRREAPHADAFAAIQEASYRRARRLPAESWPPTQAMDAGELGAFLDERRYCVVATATDRGRAQARPVGFAVWGDALWLATVAGRRLHNLRREPWASVVVSDGEGAAHRAVALDGPVTIHEHPPAAVLAAWEARFGSRPSWAAAWIELRPRRVFSHRGAPAGA